MASRAVIAARIEEALARITENTKSLGGHDAEKRLQQAMANKGRDPATRGNFILANVLDVINEVLDDSKKRLKPDPTPIEEISTLTLRTKAVLREHGYTTKGELYQAPDHELLKLPGIAPGTLQRIRAQL